MTAKKQPELAEEGRWTERDIKAMKRQAKMFDKHPDELIEFIRENRYIIFQMLPQLFKSPPKGATGGNLMMSAMKEWLHMAAEIEAALYEAGVIGAETDAGGSTPDSGPLSGRTQARRGGGGSSHPGPKAGGAAGEVVEE